MEEIESSVSKKRRNGIESHGKKSRILIDGTFLILKKNQATCFYGILEVGRGRFAFYHGKEKKIIERDQDV